MSDTVDPIEKEVAEYVALRDGIKAKEEEFQTQLKPFKVKKQQLEQKLHKYLTEQGLASVKTQEHGTLYVRKHTSARVADWSAFINFVTSHGRYDMLEQRASSGAVVEYEEETGKVPGVEVSIYETAAVRKK